MSRDNCVNLISHLYSYSCIHTYPLKTCFLPFSFTFIFFITRIYLLSIYHTHTPKVSSQLYVAEFQFEGSITKSGSLSYLISFLLSFNKLKLQVSLSLPCRCKHEFKPKVEVSSGASFRFVRNGSAAVSHAGRNKTTGFGTGETDELLSLQE